MLPFFGAQLSIAYVGCVRACVYLCAAGIYCGLRCVFGSWQNRCQHDWLWNQNWAGRSLGRLRGPSLTAHVDIWPLRQINRPTWRFIGFGCITNTVCLFWSFLHIDERTDHILYPSCIFLAASASRLRESCLRAPSQTQLWLRLRLTRLWPPVAMHLPVARHPTTAARQVKTCHHLHVRLL